MSRNTRVRKGPEDHQDWLALVSVSGPFLALPVLTRVWPILEAVDPVWWPRIKAARLNGASDSRQWVEFLLREFCGWADQFRTDGLGHLRVADPEQGVSIEPDFALVDPQAGAPQLLGLMLPPSQHPGVRPKGDASPMTHVDRMARLCRHHRVPLGLVTNGRWFALVAAPPQSVTSTAVFDTATWPESAERPVIRGFYSLLERRRFLGVPVDDRLPALFRESLDLQAEVTGVLGDQVRRAVEMLIRAMSWHDQRALELGRPGLTAHSHDVYHAAVTMVIRVIFLLFAEERRLLPADNDLYAASYSVRHLAEHLELRSQESSEQDLEHSCGAWLQLLALSEAIHSGVVHERLALPTYDGPLFDPATHPWLADVWIDDRTVLHLLKAIRYVLIKRERRRLSFRALGVEQIGHVYEKLLAYDAERAAEVMLAVEWNSNRRDEVALADLERLDSPAGTPHERAKTLVTLFTDKPAKADVSGLARRLALSDDAQAETVPLLHAAANGDRDLTVRILPYLGILRRDLRGLPLVIAPGALYMTESHDRAATGAHYTPPDFASEVVDGAMADLTHHPGPRETTDRTRWRPRPAEELLALRIADISVGSGAFLVAACRYLAQRLIEAWAAEGNRRAAELADAARRHGPPDDVEADPLTVLARRTVIEKCLYGVDVNPMATEIARLSLWLIAMDPSKPLNFLEHHIVAGDSMIGIHSLDQLSELHFDPATGRRLRERWLGDPGRGVREMVDDLVSTRRELAEQPDDSLAVVLGKAGTWRRVLARTRSATLIADLVAGAMLQNAGRPERELDRDVLAVADLARRITAGVPGAVEEARKLADRWLAADLPHGAARRRVPLHWPLVFADIFANGGFDAVIGNQPYLGGQYLSGTYGSRYRELLVRWAGGGVRGSADLVAYFVARSHDLVNADGVTALIATNTLWQGDSREVGLDRLVERGITIRRAVKSRPWPTTSATLHVCIVNTDLRPPASGAVIELDGHRVPGVTSSLDVRSRVSGKAHRLAGNTGLSFQGSNILGLGFTMSPDEGLALIAEDARNRDVLFPYLNGQDLNSRADCSASRYVINFRDWPESRARTYPECYDRVLRLVKPERERNNDKRRRDTWWRFTRLAPELYSAIAGLERVVVITLVSKTVMPVMVPTRQVFAHKLAVFATGDTAMLALLSSSPHWWWAVKYASTLEGRVCYTPSDVFETFVRPEPTGDMRRLGDRLDTFRRDLMLARQAGLTTTYNLVHDKGCHDEDVTELRAIHVDIDHAVMRAYGWDDLDLDHDFHDTRQGMRYTVGPAARQEILDRLLELNHARHADERRHSDGQLPRQLELDDEPDESAG